MTNLSARLLTVAIALAGASITIVAQAQIPDKPALQEAGLFLNGCLPFTGAPNRLRSWAAGVKLLEAPSASAAPFLAGYPGKAFMIETVGGKMVIVSRDDGACQLIVQQGVKALIDIALVQDIIKAGGSMAPKSSQVDASRGAALTVFDVRLQERQWVVSTTSRRHDDAPELNPAVTTMATGGTAG